MLRWSILGDYEKALIPILAFVVLWLFLLFSRRHLKYHRANPEANQFKSFLVQKGRKRRATENSECLAAFLHLSLETLLPRSLRPAPLALMLSLSDVATSFHGIFTERKICVNV
jgi:hypothetical protein